MLRRLLYNLLSSCFIEKNKTGVTTFFIDEKIDTGNIILQNEVFIGEDEINSAYIMLICIIVGLGLYFLIDFHVDPENYTLVNSTIETDTLALRKSTWELFLPRDMKVELVEYELSWSEAWDYTTYRLYIDSVNYIEIRNSKYDSLDAQFGTLKEKEDE